MPSEETAISYDGTIAYTTAHVKYPKLLIRFILRDNRLDSDAIGIAVYAKKLDMILQKIYYKKYRWKMPDPTITVHA